MMERPENYLTRPALARQRGFSLIEIMIVIGLLMLIMTLVISNVDGLFGGGQEDVAEMWVKSAAATPLTKYRVDTGGFPTTEQGLQALVSAPSSGGRWEGPYMKEVPKDPWGEPYQYRFPGQKNPGSYDLWSKGPDRQSGTADDIGNWKTE
ncbi:MAG: type II secretion system major pseudopilin GspG [Verrucomicrobiota bacterium]